MSEDGEKLDDDEEPEIDEEKAARSRAAYEDLIDAVGSIVRKHKLSIQEVMWLLECMRLITLNHAIGLNVLILGETEENKPPLSGVPYIG